MSGSPARAAGIAADLLAWYSQAHRDLPWRVTTDPYRIWVSEIMLQQTRAAAVIPYYARFLERFPTVQALAAAGEDDVLALWSGLGYYRRARDLRRAAQHVAATGGFPRDHGAIRALPGIGDYTAAAIASIAFDLPVVVVDGNVLRVVARLLNDASDIGSPRTRERFRDTAQQWLDRAAPGQFNQAIMELGAAVCLPKNPLCLLCPVAAGCRARQQGTAAELPVKLRRTEPVHLAATLLLVRKRGRVLLRRREAGARRMAGFWDLPAPEDLPEARIGKALGQFRHTITNHHYRLDVRAATLPREWRGSAAGQGSAAGTGNAAERKSTAGWENVAGQGSAAGTGNAAERKSTAGWENVAGQGSAAGTGNAAERKSTTGRENAAGQGSVAGTGNAAERKSTAGRENAAGQGSVAGTGNAAQRKSGAGWENAAGQGSAAEQGSTAGRKSAAGQGSVAEQGSTAGRENAAQRESMAELAWFEPARLAEIPLSTTARKALRVSAATGIVGPRRAE